MKTLENGVPAKGKVFMRSAGNVSSVSASEQPQLAQFAAELEKELKKQREGCNDFSTSAALLLVLNAVNAARIKATTELAKENNP